MIDGMVKKLEELGLTKGEARAYLTLLKLESTTVGPLVKESKIAYSKIYDVLQRLMNKGLASYIIKGNTRYYLASNPKTLYDYLDKQEQEVIANKSLLPKLLPLLTNLKGQNEQETAQVFLGHKGILSAYEKILQMQKKGGITRYFFSYKLEYEKEARLFYIDRPQYHELAEKYYKQKNIVWHGIADSKKSINPKRKYMTIKYVDFPTPGNIDITENHVLITTWSKNPIGILIESREVAKNFSEYFDNIWKR